MSHARQEKVEASAALRLLFFLGSILNLYSNVFDVQELSLGQGFRPLGRFSISSQGSGNLNRIEQASSLFYPSINPFKL
jgi:hypothetical protein